MDKHSRGNSWFRDRGLFNNAVVRTPASGKEWACNTRAVRDQMGESVDLVAHGLLKGLTAGDATAPSGQVCPINPRRVLVGHHCSLQLGLPHVLVTTELDCTLQGWGVDVGGIRRSM